MTDALLITPPFTQLNTPYPATAYLKGFLNTKGISSVQMDLGIEVILALFKKSTFKHLFEEAYQNDMIQSENAWRIYHLRTAYLNPLDEVILFLQGKNQSFARQIISEGFLPRASRFDQLDDMDWAFGTMGNQDYAKHLATLYIEDLSDFIVECVDQNFGFSRYAERLGQSANSFDKLYAYLKDKPTKIDQITLEILDKRLATVQPKLVCFSVPFPGNVYSAFRCAQFIKMNYPSVKVAMGGGFANTELRELNDIRVFDFFDYITLDDGELPIELLIKNGLHLTENNSALGPFSRTFSRQDNQVVYTNNTQQKNYSQKEVGTPDYSDLLLDQYISVIEIANPMHSLWSDGRWNKLTMAHGCYWGKCTFCDISLDYIKVYEPVAARLLVDRVEEMIAQTGETGFHFVDEAAPPALMKAFALEIIKRKIIITWWTNIRFEKNFTQDLCYLLKVSGCIAVSGGLEVASDRLLKLIDKGVSVSQVAQVTRNFTAANIMVHSYLMYGYPTQTIQETVDSLEMVRQLFELGIVQSGFWHQFALTTHSPIGKNPQDYGVIPDYKSISFANNDIDFKDETGIDHNQFSFGLKKSLYNFMHGIGFEIPLDDWFDFDIPATTVHPDYLHECLENENLFTTKGAHKIIWLGGAPQIEQYTKTKRGNSWEILALTFFTASETIKIDVDLEQGEWLVNQLKQLYPQAERHLSFTDLKNDFEQNFENFELFWYSKPLGLLRENGLVAV